MNDINTIVLKIKHELLSRVANAKKKPISSQSLKMFLDKNFNLDIDNASGIISKKHQTILDQIQEEFDKNEIVAYHEEVIGKCVLKKIPMHRGSMGVRLIYGENEFSGTVKVVKGNSVTAPYKPFQEEALEALDQHLQGPSDFACILSIPTGGGKTYTMAYWLLKNVINKKKKVLWIAHRHELLDQALRTFTANAYTKDGNNTDLVTVRTEFTYRIISGNHGNCASLNSGDDLVIASKDSLNNGVSRIKERVVAEGSAGLNYLVKEWLKDYDQELFLVVDEAHHATAASYRNIIDYLKQQKLKLKIIGLTATPTRTIEKEIGLLEKVFPDNIIYRESLKKLISSGFLSTPKSKLPVKTGIDITKLLSESEINRIRQHDLLNIGNKRLESISKNRKRNNFIVDHYVSNKETYGNTIIFAINVDNAIALNKLFTSKGIKSDYIISGTVEENTLVSNSKVNKEKIAKFRETETEVLINYNILTEGVDLPKIQTVFLTRPTVSEILMTQMIGRGLRGVKAGGTKETNVVSFIDNWHDKIMWVTPEKIINSEDDFNDKAHINKHKKFLLMSIEQLESYAILQDNDIDESTKEMIRALRFVERIPTGYYFFQLDNAIAIDGFDSNHAKREYQVFVYNHLLSNYKEFVDDLEDLFHAFGIQESIIPNGSKLNKMADQVEETYFPVHLTDIGYSREEIVALILYYAECREKPELNLLEDLNKFDIDIIARGLVDRSVTLDEKKKCVEDLWEAHEKIWRGTFRFSDLRSLNREFELAVNKIQYPELYLPSPDIPVVLHEKQEYEKKSLQEIKKLDPDYYHHLRETIFAKHSKDGCYICAKSKFKSTKRIYFHIDHKIPRKEGGLTMLANLQLLSRRENWIKGSK